MLKEGLRQGLVFSPILITIFINSFLEKFDDSTPVTAYDDDLAIARNGTNKDQVTQELRKEVDNSTV